MTSLFEEVKVGALTLGNRIVMAPLTRNRAGRDGAPGPSAPLYYAQRASAGLIVSEGAQPCALGQGTYATPGLYTPEQLAAWRRVTGAVHAAGGSIFAQVMHNGRIGHPDVVQGPGAPRDRRPVAPSAIRPRGRAKTYDGLRDFPTPRAMGPGDVAEAIAAFVTAASGAVEAGFDGVELHGAAGLLLHQFLATGTNRRTDRYGGSVANRMRFVVEVVEAVAEAVGAERVALRVSPHNTFNDVEDREADVLYPRLARELGVLGLAYLHVYEVLDRPTTRALREAWPTTLVLNPHPHDRRAPAGMAAAEEALEEGVADLVAFGRLFVSNPDLPRRLREGLPLTEPDPATFYGGGDRGYTDYPCAP